jgi:DnaJ-class molecular chaperone
MRGALRDIYQVGVKRCPVCGGNRKPKEKKRPMCPRCHNTGIVDFDERPQIEVPYTADYHSQATWDSEKGEEVRFYIKADSSTTGV